MPHLAIVSLQLSLCLALAGCPGSARPQAPRRDGQAADGLTFRDGGGRDGPRRDGPTTHDGPPSEGPLATDQGGPKLDQSKPKLDQSKPKLDKGLPCAGGCADGDPCTTDTCVNNQCVHTRLLCNDNDGCTTDACVNGSCVYTPINCDDGDPCTTDSCANDNCSYKAAGQAIYRYWSSGSGAHGFGASTTPPAGFVVEGPVFRTLPFGGAGRSTVYQQINNGNGDRMLSLSASEGLVCCGYVNGGDIGFGLTQAQGTSIPIYRLYQASSGLHLSSASNSEGVQLGYQLEGVTFHACPL